MSSSTTKQKEVTIIKREEEDSSNNDSGKIILQYAIENTLPIVIIHSILNACHVSVKNKYNVLTPVHYDNSNNNTKSHKTQNQALLIVWLLLHICPNSAKIGDNMANSSLQHILTHLMMKDNTTTTKNKGVYNSTKNNVLNQYK